MPSIRSRVRAVTVSSQQACALVALLTVLSLVGSAREASLLEAVQNVDKAAVRLLIRKGADINVAAPDGSSALHWAVNRDDLELVELLLRAGATVDATNRYGVTPLALACENGNAEIIERLLNAGADANTMLAGGETALMTAAPTGRADAIRVLSTHGADTNARDRRGQTALMWAAAKNNAPAVRLLIESGADVNARTRTIAVESKGQTEFGGQREALTSAPPTGFTPLLFAVRAGSLDAVQVLLDAGADVNDAVSDGQNALILATANAHWQMAVLLLDRGANPNLAGAGWNALHQTVKTRRSNIGVGMPAPYPTGTLDSIEVIKKLIGKGVDLNARMTTNGMKDGQRVRLLRVGPTAFLLAAKNTDTEVMRLLLAAGADAEIPNAENTTPLMVAAGLYLWGPGEDAGSLPSQEDEVLEAVRLCVERGNDVLAVDDYGWSALHG